MNDAPEDGGTQADNTREEWAGFSGRIVCKFGASNREPTSRTRIVTFVVFNDQPDAVANLFGGVAVVNAECPRWDRLKCASCPNRKEG